MKRSVTTCYAILITFTFALGAVNAQANKLWYHERVAWEAAGNPHPWETIAQSPDGKEHFRLALVPLWAVEGGIVAMEIVVARPDHPNDNLLGKRDTDGPMKFVITVEELKRGIRKSKFGATRNFNPGNARLTVEILSSRLGKGRSDCPDCPNIQEFTAILSFGSN